MEARHYVPARTYEQGQSVLIELASAQHAAVQRLDTRQGVSLWYGRFEVLSLARENPRLPARHQYAFIAVMVDTQTGESWRGCIDASALLRVRREGDGDA